MTFMSFHIDGAEWAGGTKMLAGTAADAPFCIDGRNLQRTLVALHRGYHLYGSCGAMACAIATSLSVGQGDAVLPYPHGMAYLGGRFHLACYRTYDPCGAYLRTLGALWPAISAFVRHFGLHQSRQVSRWGEHSVGAY